MKVSGILYDLLLTYSYSLCSQVSSLVLADSCSCVEAVTDSHLHCSVLYADVEQQCFSESIFYVQPGVRDRRDISV